MAQVCDVLQQLLEDLRYYSDRAARQAAGDTGYPRRWHMPTERGSWDGNPLRIDQLNEPFDRSSPDQDAQAAYTDGGSSGTGMGNSLQVAIIASMERAFRERHKQPVRILLHAAGRRKGHGDLDGLHTGDVINYLQALLDSGTK